MPASAAVQAATIEKFIADWRVITPESWTSLWTNKTTQRFLPTTIGLPPQNKDEVLVALPKLLAILKEWKLDVREVVHDTAKGKAVIYAESTADTPFELKWQNEYAVFVTLTEDGKNVEKIEEFVDTTFYTKFSQAVGEYFQKLG